MKKNEIDILKYHIKEILNKYPKTLEITIDKNELRVSFVYDYHEAWSKFLGKSYAWYIMEANLGEKYEQFYLKRLLQAKKFLREVCKNN